MIGYHLRDPASYKASRLSPAIPNPVWVINKDTIDRYINYIRDELDANHPNFARVSSLARSVAKLAEVSLTDQTLNAGD